MTVFMHMLYCCIHFDAYVESAEAVSSKLHQELETEKELNLTDIIGCICVVTPVVCSNCNGYC